MPALFPTEDDLLRRSQTTTRGAQGVQAKGLSQVPRTAQRAANPVTRVDLPEFLNPAPRSTGYRQSTVNAGRSQQGLIAPPSLHRKRASRACP